MSADPVNTLPPDPWASNKDFSALRLTVFNFLQNHNSQWTDYNYHDPGVTILEQFCFALTDLAYRTGFCMADLLQNEDGSQSDAFPGSLRFLNSFPVIRNDIRKVILDSLHYGHESVSDKIYNAWIKEIETDKEKRKSGKKPDVPVNLYTVEVQLTTKSYKELLNSEENVEQSRKRALERKIARALGSFRAICTDFDQIKILDKDEIEVTGQVNIQNGYTPEEVLARIYTQIDQFINPDVPFYTFAEMQDKGIPVNEIYEGPSLKRGFIADSDLKARTKIIKVSDISGIILKTEGVSLVSGIRVNKQQFEYEVGTKTGRTADDCYPLLKTTLKKGEVLELSKNGGKISFESLNKLKYNAFLSEFNTRKAKPPVNENIQKNITQEGKFRNTGKYYSIQKYLPAVYGIGDYGLPDKVFVNEVGTDTPQALATRKAQAKQLKAYLMLFEQILANYLTQLQNFGSLLSVSSAHHGKSFKSSSDVQTYFYQSIVDQIYNPQSSNVPNGADVLTDFGRYQNSLCTNAEDANTRVARKGAFLDHLLARVNEKIDSYPYRLYGDLYGVAVYKGKDSNLPGKKCDYPDTASIAKDLIALNKKSEYLEKYDIIGYERSKAFNYYEASMDEENVSGLEQKIALLLGIDNLKNRELHKIKDLSIKSGAGRKKSKEEILIEVHTDFEITKIVFTNDELTLFEYDFEEETDILIEENDEEKSESNNKGFHFDHTSSEGVNVFFKNGINRSCYKIEQYKHKKNHHQYYVTSFNISHTSEAKWIIIHTFEKRETAVKKLRSLIRFAIKANKHSEGFHVVEHILLRDDINPYQITIILPLWPARFQDRSFQYYVQQLFEKHSPLYAPLNFIWLDLIYMKEFEGNYFPWLDSLRDGAGKTGTQIADELKAFIKGKSP